MQIDILGTTYKVQYKSSKRDVRLKRVDGYCDYSTKTIVCIKDREKDEMDLCNLKAIDRRILRHEIIHAFMYESGLWCNAHGTTAWAQDEEMTDWFAIQSPKIYKVYEQLGILD